MLACVAYTNVHVWQGDFLKRLDETIDQHPTLPYRFDLPWSSFDLLPDDADHFTWDGYVSFVDSLLEHVLVHWARHKRVHVLSDSTIDYWNWDEDWNETRRATTHMVDAFARRDVDVSVDAVSGSGFVAMRPQKKDFHTRFVAWKKNETAGNATLALVIGGWNDQAKGLRLASSGASKLLDEVR